MKIDMEAPNTMSPLMNPSIFRLIETLKIVRIKVFKYDYFFLH